jgi:HEAT repeat protein
MLSLRPDVGTDPETCRALIARMQDRSNVVRFYAAEALGKRRTIDALRGLVQLLRDDDTDVRSAAAEAIGAIGEKESCLAVVYAAGFQDRLDIRWLTALAIAGGEVNFKQFLKYCNSNLYPEQLAGLQAMGASDRPEALAVLLKTFHDDEAMLQTEAMDALAKRGDTAVDAVREDIKSAEKNVRAHAVHLLSRINTRGSKNLLQAVAANANEDPGVRALAEFALKRFGGP